MPLPVLNFATMNALLTYINTVIIPNGVGDITGEEHNNVENALGNFIVTYTLNSGLAAVSSVTTAVTAARPITYFAATPSALQWPDNVQNEFYFVNATPNNIPFASGFVYYDEYQDPISILAARSILHIAKAVNTLWVKVSATGSGGGGGSLPPQTNHNGEALNTNGTSASWSSIFLNLTSSDFESDGRTYINTNLVNNQYDIFVNEVSRYIYNYNDEPPNDFGVEWDYIAGGGFEITAAWFNANDNNYHLKLNLRGLNS